LLRRHYVFVVQSLRDCIAIASSALISRFEVA
jgi:hypothetical protein